MGLAGYGDLIAAVAGDGRPELEVGRSLARGEPEPLDRIGAQVGAYIEGVDSARRVAAYARRVKAHAPMIKLRASVFARELAAEKAVRLLMSREVGEE